MAEWLSGFREGIARGSESGFSVLVVLGVNYLFYRMARDGASGVKAIPELPMTWAELSENERSTAPSRWRAWAWAVGAVVALATLAAWGLGRRTDCSEADGLWIGCETVGWDSFSHADWWAAFAKTFVVLSVVVSLGVHHGLRDQTTKRARAKVPINSDNQ